MFDPNGYFWWSSKLEDISKRHNPPKKHKNFCIIDGKELEYNLWTQSKDHSAKWDDLKYLGCGKYSRQVK